MSENTGFLPSHHNYELEEPPEFAEILQQDDSGKAVAMAAPVMFDDPGDEPAAAQRAQTVEHIYSARPFFWKNTELMPFAIGREADWLMHRELLGEPSLAEIIGLPNAMLNDALRVLWFLTHKPAEWLTIPAMVQDPDTEEWSRLSGQDRALIVEDKIRAWAEENVTRAEGPLAVKTFYDIWSSSRETQAQAKPSEHHEETRAKK